MDIRKYIYSHCVSPLRVKVWDTYSQQYVTREMPCGKCLHCRNSKVNEWVTRLYAQAKYSNYIYYITLDYAPFSLSPDTFSDPNAEFLAAETAATWHNINSTHKYGMHPILLVKNHLQDFFKRFRKNNPNIKIQYFACGEYGTHAEGKGYGRPHFHAIIFSQLPISQQLFSDAWSLNGYKIGNVDYHDITLQAHGNCKNLCVNSFNNPKYVFRYVCKYLQKQDFNFENLATINFHRSYFKSICTYFENADTLFPVSRPIEDRKRIAELWQKYISQYSPFVVCSKRPSIGLAYLCDNMERFQTRDFRLFGLSEDELIFPTYYMRKIKESLCPVFALGTDSQKPSSSSRLGNIMSILRSLEDSQLDFKYFASSSSSPWNICKIDGKNYVKYYNDLLPFSFFHLYNNKTKVFYQFCGSYFQLWSKFSKLGYMRLNHLSISEVIDCISPKFQFLYDNFVAPFHRLSVLHQKEFDEFIINNMQGQLPQDKYANFYKLVYKLYQDELGVKRNYDLITNNSKYSF